MLKTTTKEDKEQATEDNNLVQKENSMDNKFIKHEEIKQVLEETGILNYDSQVVTQLSDYINQYALDVLENSSTFMKHAGRKTMNLSDVQLGLEVISKKSSKRLSQKELIQMAQEHNKSQLPDCSGIGYLPLPTDGCVLTKCNYKLRSPNTPYPMNIPLMDTTNRQNSVITMNTMKNHSGVIPTMIRTPSGPMSINVPMNLNPQRIILKPQTNFSNNMMYMTQNKMDDNSIKKRLKFEEFKK